MERFRRRILAIDQSNSLIKFDIFSSASQARLQSRETRDGQRYGKFTSSRRYYILCQKIAKTLL